MKREGSEQLLDRMTSNSQADQVEEQRIKRVTSDQLMKRVTSEQTLHGSKAETDTVIIFGVPWSKKKLRLIWMKTIIMCDTQLGRDKSARFFQYFCRMVSGLIGSNGVAWQICVNLASFRRCLRFWKPVKLAKQIEDTMNNKEMRQVDKVLTVTEFGSFIFYCLLDHLRFAQAVTLLKLKAESYDLLERFIESWWIAETVPALMRETLVLFHRDKSDEQRKLAAKWILKLTCDLFSAIYFTWPLSKRNERKHKIWCGLLGSIASLLSLHIAWPSDKIVDSP